jgi:hypothetical protein
MPEIPARSGFSNVGWSLTKNAIKADYKVGQSVAVTKSFTVYAVRKAIVTFEGTSLAKKKVNIGGTLKLPSVPTVSGYRNLGWSKKKTAAQADYQAGDSVRITKEIWYS